MTDIDIEFRKSFYVREVSPQLLGPVDNLDPLVDVVSPITPALSVRISTKARPNAQGTMALYLAESGGSNRLLGLSCRHVLIGSRQVNVVLVAPRAYQGHRVPQRAPQRRRLGISTSTTALKTVFSAASLSSANLYLFVGC
jgi:hypothetical protein